MIDKLIQWLKRRPYTNITVGGDLYMRRWWVFQLGGLTPSPYDNKRTGAWLRARVHEIIRSDKDRALHDHPFDYLTFILKGGYWEITDRPTRARSKMIRMHPPQYSTWFGAGSVLFRRAERAHRLVIPTNASWGSNSAKGPAITLFIQGPKRREWGFHTDAGWVHWRDFGGD